MPPKKAVPAKKSAGSARQNDEEQGEAEQAPDFTFDDIQRRIDTFLHDSRNTRRGGAGLNLNTLLLRRTRAAIVTIYERLRDSPDTTNVALAWVWYLLRRQLVRTQTRDAISI